MTGLRGLLPVVLAVALCWALSVGGSCSRGAPQLVRVSEVTPREVELGDRLAIVGDGFPPGRQARVTFRGALYRPGERPVRDAEIEMAGLAGGPQQLQIAFSEATQALFCGAGDRAAHTTFRGDVEVAFPAAVAAAPPVTGTLRGVTLDVRPSAAPSDAERDAEGERLLAWVGIEAIAGPSGVVVRAVQSGSRADAAGIMAGDFLLELDGVRVASAGDLLPVPGAREASVVVRRAGGEAQVTRTLAVDGFRRSPPDDLVGEALVVLSALALVLLFGAPPWPRLATGMQRVVSRARASARSGVRAALHDAFPPSGTPAVVNAVACALLAAMPFGQYLVAARLDVGLLFLVAATSLAMVALLGSGSAWRGLRAAAHVAWQHVPAAIAVVGVVATTGSLRVQEIERAQGGWPWDWLAFRSPGALVACALLLACARVEPDALDGPSGLAALVEDSSSARPRGPWLAAACRAHRILIAGLAATLFLGGWLLPGLTAAQQDASPALELAGAVWLLGKTAGLVLLLAWSRAVLPRAHLAERTRATLLWLAPVSLAALVGAAAWSWWSPARAARLLASSALVAMVVLAAAVLVHRLRHGLLSPAGDGRVSPFL